MIAALRRRVKRWLYGRCPGIAGAFPYYGVRTYFPPRSYVFDLACDQGIYEARNLQVLLSAVRPGATAFDLGANIGLMSIPLLQAESTLRVVSVEPSPETHACLTHTARQSGYRDRWETLAVAVGDHEGGADFFCAAPALGAFDGLRDTHRADISRKISVSLTTLDRLWSDRGRPEVCVVKIDV